MQPQRQKSKISPKSPALSLTLQTNSPNPQNPKDLFRKQCKIRLEHLATFPNTISKDSKLQKILLSLLKTQIPKNPRKKPFRILLYLPLGIEFDCRKVLKILKKQKNIEIFTPFMCDVSFKMVKYRFPLQKKQFGVLESPNSLREIKTIHLAIVPVIGIDNQFKRIGFGKGMYDRFFETLKNKPKIVFVCREFFYHSLEITNPYDISGNYFITPFALLLRKGKYNDNLDSRKFRLISLNCRRRKLPYFTQIFTR